MSFKARLIGAFVGIVGLSLGGAALVTYVAVERSELRQLDAALLAEAREEAAEVALHQGRMLAIGAGEGLVPDDIGPLTSYGVLYAPDGSVLDATANMREQSPPLRALVAQAETPFDLELGKQVVRAVVVPVPRHDARLLLAAPRTHLDSDLRYLARTLALVPLGALVAAAMLAQWVLGRLTRDHRAIAKAARSVAAGDLSARVVMQGKAGETAQLACDVNEMIERIERLVESERRFIAHASHELRSPLTLLYGELSHALRRSRDESSYRTAIEEALSSTRRLKQLTERLLTLARLTSESPVSRGPVELQEVVRSAVQRPRDEDKGVRFALELSETTVLGDAADLERMVVNLVENAVRYSPPEGTVQVRLEQGEHAVRLHVCDQGPGIPEGDRERIFEPFYRSPSVHSAEGGAGLGLAIVRETLRTYGGTIGLQPASPEWPGAHFVVELPWERESLEASTNITNS